MVDKERMAPTRWPKCNFVSLLAVKSLLFYPLFLNVSNYGSAINHTYHNHKDDFDDKLILARTDE